MGTPTTYRSADELEQLYVVRAARGTGTAGRLIESAEARIAGGHEVAWLAVVAGNTRARRFYERVGWSDVAPVDYLAETSTGTFRVPCRRYEKRLAGNTASSTTCPPGPPRS
jgi:ribosomal protein S18 acetylase RimI-like enzyme